MKKYTLPSFILLRFHPIGIHQMELSSSLGYFGVMATRQNLMFNMTLPSRYFSLLSLIYFIWSNTTE